MGEMLQSCQSWPDAFQVVSRYAQRLFPPRRAPYSLHGIQRMDGSGRVLGQPAADRAQFWAQDVLGAAPRAHSPPEPRPQPLFCVHSQKPASGEVALHSICIPLIAQTESLAFFYLELRPRPIHEPLGGPGGHGGRPHRPGPGQPGLARYPPRTGHPRPPHQMLQPPLLWKPPWSARSLRPNATSARWP
jgi:hypothetical protein